MRLDAFLKVSRLIKRRSVAKDLCDAGRVRLGGARAKPGREVKPGDVLSVRLSRRNVVVEVVEIPQGNVPRGSAAGLYRIIEDTAIEEEFF